MATGLTYSSLISDLQSYAQRGNAVSDASVLEELPRIVNRCEVGLARKLKIQGDQITVTGTMNPSESGVVAKPVNWLDTISINYGTGNNTRTSLYPRSYEYALVYWPDRTEQDAPEYYADYDLEHWLFFPSPDDEYPFEVLYHGLPQLLDSSNQSNWLTEQMPDVLLNDCVAAFGAYLGWSNDEVQVFAALRDDALGQVTKQEMMKIIDRATARRSA